MPLPMRDAFFLPDGLIYLDGNSLGPLPRRVRARVDDVLTREWGEMLIRGWNEAGWMDLSLRVGDRIAALVGAPAGTVVAGDSTSINVYKTLAAALSLVPDRSVILSDSGNFPTDLYMAQGLIATVGRELELRVVQPEEVAQAIDSDVGVLMLTEVDYRTGRLHDMAALTERAHEHGAITLWDLAHSAGALPVDLAGSGADFAVGCGYKYLNGGPGAPAFLYVRPDHLDRVEPALSGWLGHAAPFDFDTDYVPATGIDRMRVGTPPILSLSALDAALELWEEIDMADVRAASIRLSDLFIAEVERLCGQHGLVLASPREGERRGSQVSFRAEDGYAIMQALIADGVIGDFRAPDLLRFGFTPLYMTEADVHEATARLARVLDERLWDRPEHKARRAVT